ncbi:Glycoside hydrolase family 16 protein [Mycena sanguinolenta]|uniref:Glycoside hydrolase family 16 protein n=1 Tax=Mycena sanguinolenta TaxID=230812 RepID=A0A8H6ZEL6_9AGAR|nr:Glycoside hydrolase family 16 protein [Mycena sanguinolenta]
MFAPVLLLSLAATGALASYSIQDTYIGYDFLAWKWETFQGLEPTHGRTQYVDKSTALASKPFPSDDSFIMRADNVNRVPPAAPGRKSVRIVSPDAYADSVIVLDLWHMPAGCATWPAFWTLSKAGPWPHGGEIDIIEGKLQRHLSISVHSDVLHAGVNNNTDNLSSLHTTPNCYMSTSQPRYQTGSVLFSMFSIFFLTFTSQSNCIDPMRHERIISTRDAACRSPSPILTAIPFNSHGGGWYAMKRGPACGVSIWFWSRYNPSVPLEVSQGRSTINPDPALWGIPDAVFPMDNCDYSSHFDAHSIVFDLTFCGDWAGTVYGDSGCPGSCIDFVDNNPEEFDEAYWQISSLRIYTPDSW